MPTEPFPPPSPGGAGTPAAELCQRRHDALCAFLHIAEESADLDHLLEASQLPDSPRGVGMAEGVFGQDAGAVTHAEGRADIGEGQRKPEFGLDTRRLCMMGQRSGQRGGELALLRRADRGQAEGFGEAQQPVAPARGERVRSVPGQRRHRASHGDAVREMISNQIDFAFVDATFAVAQAKQGRLRILGVTTRERLATAPDLPTMAEAGAEGYVFTPKWASWLPKGTPKEVVEKVAGLLRDIARSDETKAFLMQSAATPLLTNSVNRRHTDTPTSSQLAGADVLTDDTWDAGIGVSQLTPWGGRVDFGLTGSYSLTNNSFVDVNPAIPAGLAFNINQPLLRNFGRLPTEINIETARNARDASYQTFIRSVQTVIDSVEPTASFGKFNRASCSRTR